MFISKVGVVLALVAGTGGALTADYVVAKEQRGYRLPAFAGHKAQQPVARRRTASEKLARVREVLTPSVTELSRLFNVSRQAVYNWQAGQPVAAQNEDRLNKLADAAELFAARGLTGDRALLRRKLPGGRTFYEAIEAGDIPESAIQQVLAVYDKESAEARRVEERLATRERRRLALDDVGAPDYGV